MSRVKLYTCFNTHDMCKSELSNSQPAFLKLSPECLSAGDLLCPGTNSKHGHNPESHPHSPRLSRHTLPLPAMT